MQQRQFYKWLALVLITFFLFSFFPYLFTFFLFLVRSCYFSLSLSWTHYIAQAGLELFTFLLPHIPTHKCRNKWLTGICYYTQPVHLLLSLWFLRTLNSMPCHTGQPRKWDRHKCELRKVIICSSGRQRIGTCQGWLGHQPAHIRSRTRWILEGLWQRFSTYVSRSLWSCWMTFAQSLPKTIRKQRYLHYNS